MASQRLDRIPPPWLANPRIYPIHEPPFQAEGLCQLTFFRLRLEGRAHGWGKPWP